MTTSMGVKPIETECHSLLSLSAMYPPASRISEAHLHSQATSPTDSESVDYLASQSSTRSLITIPSSVDESKVGSNKASVGAQEVLKRPTEMCSITRTYVDTKDSTARGSPSSDLLETGSDVSRTSYRRRKPTPKAQALLGSKLCRSFAQGDSPTERNEKDLDTISVAGKQQADNEDRLLQCAQKLDSHNLMNAAPSDTVPDSLDKDDEGQEGSESKEHIPRRQSKRERKPASRLIESDELIKTPKRNISHSPATGSSVKRVKLSVTPSKLKACLERTDDAEEQTTPKSELSPEASTVKVEADTISSSLISIDEPKGKSLIVILKLPSNLRKLSDEYVNNKSPNHQESSHDVEPPASTTPDRSPPSCDLSCLAPESLLLAYAEVAADWPDSDAEDDPKIELHEEQSRLRQRLKRYCKCKANQTRDSPRTDLNKKARINCGRALS